MSFTSFTTLWKCAPRENTGVSCREMHVHITVTIHNGRQLTWPICRWGGCGRSIRSGCGISIHGRKSGTKFIGTNIPKFKRFGHGFYLAPHSSKCHDYTRGSHTHRAMLLCDVLPGKKHVVTTDQTHLTAPPQGYDSVYGQPAPGCLNYPEIVLFDEASILPRYVIMYQKDGIGKIAK